MKKFGSRRARTTIGDVRIDHDGDLNLKGVVIGGRGAGVQINVGGNVNLEDSVIGGGDVVDDQPVDADQ